MRYNSVPSIITTTTSCSSSSDPPTSNILRSDPPLSCPETPCPDPPPSTCLEPPDLISPLSHNDPTSSYSLDPPPCCADHRTHKSPADPLSSRGLLEPPDLITSLSRLHQHNDPTSYSLDPPPCSSSSSIKKYNRTPTRHVVADSATSTIAKSYHHHHQDPSTTAKSYHHHHQDPPTVASFSLLQSIKQSYTQKNPHVDPPPSPVTVKKEQKPPKVLYQPISFSHHHQHNNIPDLSDVSTFSHQSSSTKTSFSSPNHHHHHHQSLRKRRPDPPA